MDASTVFKTENAEWYLGTLCKHFGHKVSVNCAPGVGFIALPFGQCRLGADASGPRLTATAPDQPGLDRTIEVLTSHLECFAFREHPVLAWATVENSEN